MRDLHEVLGAILEVVPKEETDIRAVLTKERSNLGYTAPEVMGWHWRRVAGYLTRAVGPVEPGWKQQVSDIFMGEVGA